MRSDHGHTEAYKRLIEQSAFDSSAMEETVWRPYRALHHKIRTQVPPENQRFAIYECSSGPCGGFGVCVAAGVGVEETKTLNQIQSPISGQDNGNDWRCVARDSN